MRILVSFLRNAFVGLAGALEFATWREVPAFLLHPGIRTSRARNSPTILLRIVRLYGFKHRSKLSGGAFSHGRAPSGRGGLCDACGSYACRGACGPCACYDAGGSFAAW